MSYRADYQRAYYLKHRDKRLAYWRAYHAANKERRNARSRVRFAAWRKRNHLAVKVGDRWGVFIGRARQMIETGSFPP